MPEVSVIIPTYNREQVLRRSIDSVLRQSLSDFELLVVDDNSTDSTSELLASYRDSRIRYIRKTISGGACVARNLGIQKAEGKFIAFQDSDDEWHQEKLEIQRNELSHQNADVVACPYRRNAAGRAYVVPSVRDSLDTMLSRESLLLGNIVGTPTIFGKSEVFKTTNFDENLHRFQDWDLVLRILKRYKVYMSSVVLVDCFIQADSITVRSGVTSSAYESIYTKNRDLIDVNQRRYRGFYSRWLHGYAKEGRYEEATSVARRYQPLYSHPALFLQRVLCDLRLYKPVFKFAERVLGRK